MLEPQELEEGYYQTNFISLLEFVEDKYGDLLLKKERSYLETVRSLSQDACRLYIRLILRVGPHFRRTKLNYPEIKDLEEAQKELEIQGLLATNQLEDLEELLDLFTKPELETCFKTLWPGVKCPKGRRSELVEALLESSEEEIFQWAYELDELLTPLEYETMLAFRLFFFGNLYQDMSEFILEDLGVLKFEPYKIGKEDRAFPNRKVFRQVRQIIEWREEFYWASEEEEIEVVDRIFAELIQLKPSHFLVERRQKKFLAQMGRYYERQKLQEAAVGAYEASGVPPSRERRVRMLEKKGEYEQALALCKKMQEGPADVTEEEFLAHFPDKLLKKLNRPYKKRKRATFLTVDYQIDRDFELRVEAVLLHHLQSEGWQGYYIENHFWRALFGLFLWNEIFTPQQGAFYHPFQRGPSDALSSSFYRRRQLAIDGRLSQLQDEESDWRSEILWKYEEKYKTANLFVSWKRVPKEMLEVLLPFIPSTHMASICRRLLSHPGRNGSGFPDLIVYRNGEYKMVEVKGPGDHLQASQKRWLKTFEDGGLPYEVARVQWS